MEAREDADRHGPSAPVPRTPADSVPTRDAKLRAITEFILAMPVDDHLRQLESEANFFGSVRQSDV